ncbi:MAG: hypothetical protein UV40_C0007G0005 [Parcubacteria group bacterium GW2011_GWA1_42_7]|nr:MAG: hypothetical protein UV40_C0007G0005 [Parcubacteria group bacterium GW2011_GWA1_42_7]
MLKKRLSAPVRKIILFVAVLSVMFCLVCLFLFSFAFYKITEFKK